MGWRRSCSLGVMQVEQPDQGIYMMPIVWYWAPTGAKTYYGETAFSSGIWDPEKVSLPPQLGEQPPYAFPVYDGANIWGYVGQCVIGTPQQFAQGLSAADLAAIPAAIPACCAPARTGQTWYLRHNLTPPQSTVPGVFVGSNWGNVGAAVDAGLLEDLPGSAAEGPTFDFTGVLPRFGPTGFLQFLSRPLPAQTIPAQPWRFATGYHFSSLPNQNVRISFTLSVVDGATGLQKSEIVTGEAFASQPLFLGGSHTDVKTPPVTAAVIDFRDYLCLEIGLSAGSIFAPFPVFDLTLLDSGTTPIPNGGSNSADPQSILAWPPTPVDPDMPLPGTILPFAGPAVPAGYLLCDGSIHPQASFPGLYLAIGTTWGAGGAGTFRVPDLRDRCLIGTSPGALDPARPSARNLGDVGGDETHTLVIGELAAHTHLPNDPGHTHGAAGQNFETDQGGGGGGLVPAGGTDGASLASTATAYAGVSVQITGGDGPHNNVQPFAAAMWIIKV